MIVIKEPVEFEWDKGNENKNWLKHEVSIDECEQTFFDNDRKIYDDVFHSGAEERFILIGKTEKQRFLYIVFTIRNNKVRIISARDINKRPANEICDFQKSSKNLLRSQRFGLAGLSTPSPSFSRKKLGNSQKPLVGLYEIRNDN